MILVFIIAAAPAFLMYVYVYNRDTIEKEPKKLLRKLIILGAVSVIPAVILELIGGAILNGISGISQSTYIILEMFCVVAVSEELSKFVLLKLGSWKDPNFNYMYDGMLYSVCVAIGFSVLEDIMYIFETGLATGIVRGLTFVPGHFGFAVFSGLVYSKARETANRGDHGKAFRYMVLAVVAASIMHGFYDSCLTFGTTTSLLLFLAFVIIMYIAVFKMINKASKLDHPI